ncbi:MAG: TonB-dependent receptor [Gammaproteobacteria bacterium]|nr:TonB-dependent receptor [Gammaproteobacteria bacterium]
MQLNASYFYMDWDDFQIEVVDPSGQSCTAEVPVICGNPWLKVVGNVGDAHTAGFLVEAEWVPADGWDLGANAQWLEAQSDEEIILNARLNSAGEPRAVVTEGLELPNTPDLQVSAWGSYTWSTSMVPGGQFTLSGSYSYRGESRNRFIPQPESSANPSFTNEAYHWLGARLALWAGEADWQVDVFVNNLTDERADYWHGTGNFEWQFSHSTDYEHYHRVWTNRPREFGIRFAKWWR